MKKKLRVLFVIILVAFIALGIRLFTIARNNGEEYAKIVLSQQEYDSTTIPYKRGDIYDSNGMLLATSNKVYNVILDCSLITESEDYIEPTLNALSSAFGIDASEVRSYITSNPNSKYKVLAKKVSYEEVSAFQEIQNDEEKGSNIKGIWFEDEYQRQYPNGSLACDVIGFTTNDNLGSFGLEEYYDDTLSGTNGREYGYLNEDSDLERTVIPAVDGYSIISTVDSNIQSIVEKYLVDFNDQYKDNAHEGNGAENVGCIIMEVDTGNVLAMASYPTYDLNNPRDTSALVGMRQVDSNGNKTTGEPVAITTNLATGEETRTNVDENTDISALTQAIAAKEAEKAAESADTELTADNSDAGDESEDGTAADSDTDADTSEDSDADEDSDEASDETTDESAPEETEDTGETSEDTDDGDDSTTTVSASGFSTQVVTESLYVTPESIALMDDDTLYQNYNALWKNFCINTTYEPGSVAKPFTVAAALDTGSITGNESYNCNGYLTVGDYDIKCHNIYGDGLLTVAECVERSCNVGLMNIAFATGKTKFLQYQHAFGFGLKTNIDLAGESRTASLVYNEKTMGQTELATNSFGQGFNVTMIQMITGFCSLINGGNFYEPHMVSKIVTSDGSTIENIEPRILKQTVSESTSEKIIEYCNQVVTGEHGTGKTARPAGYMIGGKTGTAETLPRGNGDYVVSFMGYAPADDPQIAIYVVVDRPNSLGQDDAKFATKIVRNILTEVLPYLHIYMTEELTDDEKAELAEKNLEDTTSYNQGTSDDESSEEALTEENIGETDSNDTGETVNSDETSDEASDEEITNEEPWKDFPIDANTGYAVDPDTGKYVDPTTGAVIGEEENLPETGAPAGGNTETSAVGDAPDQ